MSGFEDVKQLALAAKESLQAVAVDFIYPALLDTVLFAVHTALTIFFIYHRWFNRKKTPFLDVWLCLVLTMFALMTVYWAFEDVYLVWAAIKFESDQLYAAISGENRARIVPAYISVSDLVTEILATVMLITGDCVALWRAYVLYERPRWFRIMCMVMAIILLTISGILIWATSSESDVPSDLHVPVVLYATSQFLTWIPHILSTALIARKAWLHWKAVSEFAYHSGTRYSLAILLVMIESGIIYLCIYSIYIALFLHQLVVGNTVTTDFFIPIAAMYPVSILLLVAARKSVLERTIELVSTPHIMRFAGSTSRTQRSRSGTEDRLGSAIHTGRAGDHEAQGSSVPRIEVSFGSTVESGNVIVAKKDSVHPGDDSDGEDEQEPMLTESSHHSRANSEVSGREGCPVIAETV